MAKIALPRRRVFYFDSLRCFAILSIVACHVLSGMVTNKSIFGTDLWLYSVFLNALRDIAVPLFVAISGALLFDRKETISSFFRKRFIRVIIPYIFWMVVFVLFVYYGSQIGISFSGSTALPDIIHNTFSLKPTGSAVFFWFVPMMLTVYIIVFVLDRIGENFPEIFNIALIVSIFVIFLCNLGVLPLTKPYTYPIYAVYAILGYFLSKVDFTVKSLRINENKLAVWYLILSVGLYLLLFLLIVSSSLSANKYISFSQFSYLNVVLVCCVFLFGRYFSESGGFIGKIHNKIEKSNIGEFIKSVSKTSFGIYLSHVIVNILLVFLLSPYKDLMGDFIFINLILILTIIIPWLSMELLSDVPYVNKLVGAS